jgi:hypothetical protein
VPSKAATVTIWAAGVSLNLLSKGMGRASLAATAIHANAPGAKEQGIAARMWRP